MIELSHDELLLNGFRVGNVRWSELSSISERRVVEYYFGPEWERDKENIESAAYERGSDAGYDVGRSDGERDGWSDAFSEMRKAVDDSDLSEGVKDEFLSLLQEVK